MATYDTAMKLEWLRVSLSTRVTEGQDYNTMLEQFANFEELRNELYTQINNEGNILHVGTAWVVPVMQYSAIRIVRYAVGLCTVAFMGAACVLTMSFRLAAFCVVCIGSSMGCLLYTSDAADEEDSVDLGGCRIIKNKKRWRNILSDSL
eukprot:TRINITY_DN18368_c0_g1_i2.p1 TRINITY_DN18368_c0_g1~~TRINITY_DN18368_c0_g1_i2.p1  ORF type:complete len:149 (+),score=18.05 TRINITY_DN18368_c0_g1_i2:127-573(+)